MTLRNSLLTSAALVGAISFVTPESKACGGLFCSATQPVNQAAERIVFAQNDDGTVTAIIQILYQGPSESFSWLLPISTVPDPDTGVGVSSDVAFARLQFATNPQYTLTTTVEGTCLEGAFAAGGASATGGRGSATGSPVPPVVGGVTVEASGVVGAFDWTVISLDQDLDDPAGAAVAWLEDNGYDVSPGSPELIGPYLADGMYLLALKLTKNADVGSIRPIKLTYEADKPMIPIKLTAVAANDDMGVMTWVLGNERAVPFNYYALELNEAYINWFNAASNYDDVVTRAADEAEGLGFVTELAGSTDALEGRVWSEFEETQWRSDQRGGWATTEEAFQNLDARYGSFSGFRDAVRVHITLPEDLPLDEFLGCPACYAGRFELDTQGFLAALEEDVIEPLRSFQKLLDDHPYVTRLYSTLSAAEMVEDPLFTFNRDLPDVPNLHTATRVIECNPKVTQNEAPWRVVLPQGGTVRGTGAQAQSRTWPQVPEQPANLRILQLGATGSGMVAEDNTQRLRDLNDPPSPPGTGGAASAERGSEDSGCAVTSPAASQTGALTLFFLSMLALPLRRRRWPR